MALDADKSQQGPSFARTRREVPSSPRVVLRASLAAERSAAVADVVADASTVLGLGKVRDLWRAAAVACRGEDEEAASVAWAGAVEATRAYLTRAKPPERGAVAEVRRLVKEAHRVRKEQPEDRARIAEMVALLHREDEREPLRAAHVERSVAAAVIKAERCGECQRVYVEEGREGYFLAAMRCNARVCLECLRRRMRRTFDRWAPLFAVNIREGYRGSFVTIGSVRPVVNGADVRAYLRRLGTVLRAMREGDEGSGVAPRSWVAGLRALEVIPRPSGGFGHAHLVVMCRAWWPYGLSEVELRRRAVGAGWPAAEVAKLDAVKLGTRLRDLGVIAPRDLGFRHILRRAGCGEVFQDDPLHSSGEVDAAAVYMKKIERYMKKVERTDNDQGGDADLKAMTWGGRIDLHAAMRGVRLVDAFGDARGVLGGPDKLDRRRNGAACGALVSLGVYDPSDPDTWDVLPGGIAEEGGPELSIDRRTFYVTPKLDAWAEWADVARLRDFMAGKRAHGVTPTPPSSLLGPPPPPENQR